MFFDAKGDKPPRKKMKCDSSSVKKKITTTSTTSTTTTTTTTYSYSSDNSSSEFGNEKSSDDGGSGDESITEKKKEDDGREFIDEHADYTNPDLVFGSQNSLEYNFLEADGECIEGDKIRDIFLHEDGGLDDGNNCNYANGEDDSENEICASMNEEEEGDFTKDNGDKR